MDQEGEPPLEPDRSFADAIASTTEMAAVRGLAQAVAPIQLVEILDSLEGRGTFREQRLDLLRRLAVLSIAVDALREDMDTTVADARELEATWSDIGRAAGITPQSAHRRWDPDAKRKHAAYQRARRAAPHEAD